MAPACADGVGDAAKRLPLEVRFEHVRIAKTEGGFDGLAERAAAGVAEPLGDEVLCVEDDRFDRRKSPGHGSRHSYARGGPIEVSAAVCVECREWRG